MRVFTFKSLLIPVVIVIALLSSFKVQAIDLSFTGATSSDWNVASNWSPAQIPTSSDAVTIPNGKIVTLSSSGVCGSLIIKSGLNNSSLTLNGNSLVISGNLFIEDGKTANTMDVGAGTLTVGGNVLISGNGNDQSGVLTVSTGTVNVAGNFGFAYTGNGNSNSKFVYVTTGSGSILIGGEFTNPTAGTIDPAALDNIFPQVSYFKTLATGSWSTTSNWQISLDNINFYSSRMVPSGVAKGISISANNVVSDMPSLSISSATSINVYGTLNIGLNVLSGSGSFILNSGATLITANPGGISASGASGSIQVSGTGSQRSYDPAANYIYNGTSAQVTGTGLSSVNNLTINNAAGVSLTSECTINGNLTLTSGTFDAGINMISGGAGFTNSGNGTLKTQNTSATPIPAGKSWSGDVYFNSTSAQTVTNGNYTNLITSGGNRTLKSSGIIGVSGIFTPGTGTYTVAGSTVDFNGNGAQSVPAFSFNNLSISAGGTKTMAGNVTVGGNLAFSSADLSIGSNLLTLNGGITGTTNLIGSSDSEIAIGGGASPVSLGFRTGCGLLKNYTQSRVSTVTLSNALNMSNLVTMAAGSVLASNGNLTLLSSASSYAQIGQLTGTGQVTGDVNVQSFFTGGGVSTNRGSRIISTPVVDNASTQLYQQLKTKVIITGPGNTANGFDLGGSAQPNAVTLQTYSEAGMPTTSFVAVPNITNTYMVPGQAVFLFYRGDRTVNYSGKVNATSGSYASPEDVIGNYKGVINSGPISVPISFTNNANDSNNGINAIGNPYPAAIDWESVYASNISIVDNEIRVIKPGGGVMTRKLVSGTIQVTNGNAATAQYIQPGQGFYIQKKAAGVTNLNFLESHKAVNNAASRLLSLPSNQIMAVDFKEGQTYASQTPTIIRINIEQGLLKDESVIVFKQGLNSALDKEDAIYFAGNTVLVGSLTSDNQVTSINAMPQVSATTELKLYVSASASGTCKLHFTDLSAADGYQVLLKDAVFPDKVIDLKEQSSYSFDIDKTKPATYGTSRFKVVFLPEPAAVTYTDFVAEKLQDKARLEWVTSSEYRSAYFEPERSTDGKIFTKLSELKATGTTSQTNTYSFVDEKPELGINYYRLKQVNKDGKVTYSNTVSLIFESLLSKKNPGFIVFPNPAKDHVTVLFNKPYQSVQVKVMDVNGRAVKTSKLNTVSSNDSFNVDLSSQAGGMYIFECTDLLTKKSINRFKVFKN